MSEGKKARAGEMPGRGPYAPPASFKHLRSGAALEADLAKVKRTQPPAPVQPPVERARGKHAVEPEVAPDVQPRPKAK